MLRCREKQVVSRYLGSVFPGEAETRTTPALMNVQPIYDPQVRPLASRLPVVRITPTRGVMKGKTWEGNKKLLDPPRVTLLPPHWDVDSKGQAATIEKQMRNEREIRVRDSTDDVARIHEMRKGGWAYSAEEEEFGQQSLGFPTSRRPTAYRRTMVKQADESFEKWIQKFPKMIGELVTTDEQKRKVNCLIATWRDVFVENIRDMPKTDLIEHRIPIYQDAIPSVAKPVLYTQEEEEWQRINLPKLVDTGIITQCISPWNARSRFPRKENGSLRMMHAFMSLNRATIKANYLMKRIELILKKIRAPWLKIFFKTDASNGYWAVKVFSAEYQDGNSLLASTTWKFTMSRVKS